MKKQLANFLGRAFDLVFFDSHICNDMNTNPRSAVTWRTVHEHIAADAFQSKKSSSATV